MILIIGSNGQLGREMQRALTKAKLDFVAYDYPDIDITKKENINTYVLKIKPSAIINCAAYTNVDKAEADQDSAYQINALGPKYLAEICQTEQIELIHVSTDYVFSGKPIIEDGKPRAYVESDPCAPNTVYGKTKLAGEQFVMANCQRYYILRTAWLYGEGNNFVRTMLKLAETRDSINVVNDQYGSPTSTVDLAAAIIAIMNSGEYGLYHATCEGQCSWYDFARKIFEIKGLSINVKPVSTAEFGRPTPRPQWSVLDNRHLKMIGKNIFRTWEESLKEYLSFT